MTTTDTSSFSDLDLGPSEEIRCPSCGTGARITLDAVRVATPIDGDPHGTQIGTVHADGRATAGRYPGFPPDDPSVALQCTCGGCGTRFDVIAAQWHTQVRITTNTHPRADNDTNERTAS